MYGSSGAGGATMGGGTGGSVGMAETPKFMGMGIQGAIAESQIYFFRCEPFFSAILTLIFRADSSHSDQLVSHIIRRNCSTFPPTYPPLGDTKLLS